MPHRQQLAIDLAAMEQRVREGEGYLLRMHELLERTRENCLDTSNAEKVIAEMEATRQGFIQRREELARALADAGTDPGP